MIEYEVKIKQLVDNLKASCYNAGLSGSGNDYKIIVQSFLYKFTRTA